MLCAFLVVAYELKRLLNRGKTLSHERGIAACPLLSDVLSRAACVGALPELVLVAVDMCLCVHMSTCAWRVLCVCVCLRAHVCMCVCVLARARACVCVSVCACS